LIELHQKVVGRRDCLVVVRTCWFVEVKGQWWEGYWDRTVVIPCLNADWNCHFLNSSAKVFWIDWIRQGDGLGGQSRRRVDMMMDMRNDLKRC
jgi:hypothetical protein